jgi:hypothetical protein
MYIEVLHDDNGHMLACYCSDTLPSSQGAPLLAFTGVPPGLTHARLNIDTLTAMEIENGSGPRAVMDPSTGLPRIEETDRTRYVMDNFEVDPARTVVQGGVSLKGIRRKA